MKITKITYFKSTI